MGVSKLIECGVALVTRQQHLTGECLNLIQDCHLYIVSRRARTYVDPATARIRRGVARGHVIVEAQEGVYARKFRSGIAPQNIELQLLYGPSLDYCSIVSKRSQHRYLSGDSWAFAFHVTDFDPHLSTQEVLYIGRSLGNTGERIALDRILDHKTLQKIYADHQSTEFDIFITFLRITDAHTLTRLGSPESFAAVDRAGIGSLVASVFRPPVERLREQVMLAEAALIVYFQPTSYNHNLLKLPNRSSKLARNIDDRGYTNIEVALTDSATGVRYWSPSREPARYHRFLAHLPTTTSAKAGDLAVAAHEIAEQTQITTLRIAESVEQAPICHTILPGKPPRERDSRLRQRSSRPGPLS